MLSAVKYPIPSVLRTIGSCWGLSPGVSMVRDALRASLFVWASCGVGLSGNGRSDGTSGSGVVSGRSIVPAAAENQGGSSEPPFFYRARSSVRLCRHDRNAVSLVGHLLRHHPVEHGEAAERGLACRDDSLFNVAVFGFAALLQSRHEFVA